jgi:HlyD family secretion protein
MNKKWIALGVIGLALGVPVVVKMSSSGKAKHQAEMAKVEKKEIRPAILASGNLVYRQEVQLSSEVMGKVAEVLVKEGDKVEKGQVLMRLDPTTLRAEVAQHEANRRVAEVAIDRAQANLDNQNRQLERASRLVKDKFIDASKFDESTHMVALAKIELRGSRESLQQVSAMLSQARERLAKTEVRSPITGTATNVQIKVGETAVPSATSIAGSSLMAIADVGSLMAEVNVDESAVARVSAGQVAKIFPAAFNDKPVTGKVESVSMVPRVSQQGSRSYIVKLQLENNALALRTGMSCRVEIATGTGSSRLVLPIQAIMSSASSGGKEVVRDGAKPASYVFAIVDGVARKKTIVTGVADDDNQEVVSGVALGDLVAVGPARILRELADGDKVDPVKPAVKPSATASAAVTASAPAAAPVKVAGGSKP